MCIKKGKEKIEDSPNNGSSELWKPVCEICLSNDGKAYRGKLDYYDYYSHGKRWSFDILCANNALSPYQGLHGRKINVSLGDQVYQPSEKEIMGIIDPYANLFCSECNQVVKHVGPSILIYKKKMVTILCLIFTKRDDRPSIKVIVEERPATGIVEENN